MEPLYQVDEAMASTIREILDTTPTCPQCGGDADDCGCALVDEEDEEGEKEPSGDKEDIVINPEIDVNVAKQRKIDEWAKAIEDRISESE